MYRQICLLIGVSMLLLLTFTRCGSGGDDYLQDYYPLVYRGDLAFFEQKYEKTYETLKKAVAHKRPPNFEPYLELEKLANVCARLDKPEESLRYMEQLVDRGYPLTTFQHDEVYAPVWQLPAWKALEEDYAARRAAYLQNVNMEVRAAVAEMNRKDQMYRNRPDRQQYRQEQIALDTENLAQLQEIFDKYGYPNYDLIGHPSIDEYTPADLSIEPILMRSPDSLRQKYFIPKLHEFVARGECPPRMLAMIIDHYHLQHDGYQLYATMLGPQGILGRLEQARRVDKRRLEIGMPTMQMELSRDSAVNVYLMLQGYSEE